MRLFLQMRVLKNGFLRMKEIGMIQQMNILLCLKKSWISPPKEGVLLKNK
ncbi:hypothetical protein SAMN05444147_11267 [Pectobacterium carotovorum]|nr:hypothetical protein SAMN05444147_11267 [Pectobacterium carotovorum]